MKKNRWQRAKKERKFLELYEQYGNVLFRHCYFRVSDREVAKDVLQDVFLSYWDVIFSRGTRVENPRAYLYRLARNRITDHYRKKKSSSLDTLIDGGFSVQGEGADEVMRESETRELMGLLGKLEEEDKEILIYRYIDGLPPAEIAELLEITSNNASVRIHRATEKLKQIVNNTSL